MMSENNIIFEKLILQGFGPYKEQKTFTFNKGINGYIAENETGKTSMMAGLLATIFGLSHRQRNTAAFNLERFRNWNHPSACCGSLFLSSNGTRYQIERDFDTHRVSLLRFEAGDQQRELLVEGLHNPEARKPLKLYEETLLGILGVSNQELFEDIFFVTQPLPEIGQVSSELQGMLSGGKGTTFKDALEWLLSNLKNITKYTGPNDRGVTTRNMGKDGTLEQITNTIQTLKTQIVAGQQTADSLIEVQNNLSAIEENHKIAQNELKQKTKTKEAWSGWQLLASQYSAAAKERGKLQTAAEDVKKINSDIDQIDKVLKGDYPEFEDCEITIEEDLNELLNLTKQVNKVADDIKLLECNLEDELIIFKEKNSRLKDFQEWDILGADPAEKIRTTRRIASACLKSWDAFQNDQNSLQAINLKLKEGYDLFTKANNDEIDVIKNINQIQSNLKIDSEKSREAFTAAETKINEWKKKQNEHERKFSDLIGLPEEASTAALKKWTALKKQRELESQLQEMGQTQKVPVGFRIVAGGIFSSIAFFLIGTSNIPMLIMGMIIAFLVGSVGIGFFYRQGKTPGNRSSIQHELDQVKEQIAVMDQQLGKFSHADDMELARLVERLSNYKEEELQINELNKQMSALDLTALKREMLEKEKETENFADRIKKYTDKYKDVPEAYNEWLELLKEQHNLEISTQEFVHENFGCEADMAEEADPTDLKIEEQWRELAGILKALVGTDSDLGLNAIASMIKQVAKLTDSWWKDKEERATELNEIRSTLVNLEHQLQTIKNRIDEEKTRRDLLLESKVEYENKLSLVLKANEDSAEKALEKLKEYRKQIRAKDDLNTRLRTILQNYQVDDQSQIMLKYQRSNDQVASRMLSWQNHIEKYPGLPDPEYADDFEFLNQKLEKIENAIISADNEVNQLYNQRLEKQKQLAVLEGANPINIAAAEIELQELIGQQKKLEQQADAYTLAYRELGAAITDYSQAYQQRLEEKATMYFQIISGVNDRRIVMDDQLNIGVKANDRPITLERLSKGARDQMYISLRFAIADLISDDVVLPFVFDDPFASTDSVRLERIRRILEEQGNDRQFFILSHAEEYSDWGEAIDIA